MKSYPDEMNFGFLAITDLTKEILDKSAVTKLHLPTWKTRSPIAFIIHLKEYSLTKEAAAIYIVHINCCDQEKICVSEINGKQIPRSI